MNVNGRLYTNITACGRLYTSQLRVMKTFVAQRIFTFNIFNSLQHVKTISYDFLETESLKLRLAQMI